MKPLDRHAFDLQHTILRVLDVEPWMLTCDWLTIAAGLREVSFDSRHDWTDIFCEPARHWNDRTDHVRRRYLLQVTRLLYLCGALESAAASRVGKKLVKKVGIVRAVAHATQLVPIPDGYEHVAWHIAISARTDPEFRDRIRAAASCPFRGAAAFLAYELRNRVAHGALDWPDMRDEEAGLVEAMCFLVELSARAILLTIQMLALAECTPAITPDDVKAAMDDPDEDDENPARLVLLHLRAPTAAARRRQTRRSDRSSVQER